jgi:hypothetical protein
MVQSGGVPGLTAGDAMVEAAGQLIHFFRNGLDYAFILLDPSRISQERSVLSGHARILVPARPPRGISRSMSLYRAAAVGLLLPLGVAMPDLRPAEGFTE